MNHPQPQGAAPEALASRGTRRRLMVLLALAILIAALAYGLYYFFIARFYEETNDAYVNGNVVQITPQVVGTIIAVNADDTQVIQKGQPLVLLDPADARVALQRAEADLAQTVRQVRTLYVNNSQYQATVAQRQADLSRARNDLRRRLSIAQTGAISQEEISHARDTAKIANAALDAARQQLASNRVLTSNVAIAQHPNVLAAAAKVRDAYLNYARNTLPAPVSGYVAKRSAQVGQRVSPGTPLMAIVPLNEVWVDANFKEVQLKHMRIGQPVELVSDIYGSSVVYHGKIQGFSAGTGAAFSLLPAQNATGNWIKVVQRLPVRIRLDAQELRQHPLRIGLSMTANVSIKNRQSGELGNAPNTIYQTNVFDEYGKQADAQIAKIIALNGGGSPMPAASAGKPSSTSSNQQTTVELIQEHS